MDNLMFALDDIWVRIPMPLNLANGTLKYSRKNS